MPAAGSADNDHVFTTTTIINHRWEGLTMVHLPGHTPGSVFIQYKEHFLFTGDSLHWSRVDGRLTGFRCVLY